MKKKTNMMNRRIWSVALWINLKIVIVFCPKSLSENLQNFPLRQKCPNTEFFLVCIFLHSDWIRRDTILLRIQSECKKYRLEKTPYLDTFHAVFGSYNTLILGESIIKKVSDNIITKSVKHQKNVVVKILFRAKIVGMNHYKKPKREKSSAEVVIHADKND